MARQAKFQMPIPFRGVTTTTTINLKFRFINADHHHLWWEFGCKGCVSCGWAQQERVAGLFLHPPRTVRQCGQKCRVFVASGDSDVTVHQPILHSCKGAFSRLAAFVAMCLVPEDRLVFLKALIVLHGDMPRRNSHVIAVHS